MVKITPPGEPVPITATFGFVCKWCGGERQVIYGYSASHECTVYHSAREDFDFVIQEIRVHEASMAPSITPAHLRQMAADAIAEHSPRPPVETGE